MGIFDRKVLIVEDEPLIRGLISANLVADGFFVRAAGSSAEARKPVYRPYLQGQLHQHAAHVYMI